MAVSRIKIKCGLGRKSLTRYSTKLLLGVGLVVQFDHVTMFKVFNAKLLLRAVLIRTARMHE